MPGAGTESAVASAVVVTNGETKVRPVSRLPASNSEDLHWIRSAAWGGQTLRAPSTGDGDDGGPGDDEGPRHVAGCGVHEVHLGEESEHGGRRHGLGQLDEQRANTDGREYSVAGLLRGGREVESVEPWCPGVSGARGSESHHGNRLPVKARADALRAAVY